MRAAPATEVEHIVEAIMPDARIRRLLKMTEGEPCLRLRRRTWSGPLRVSAARLIYPGHAHRFAHRFYYRTDGTSKRSFICVRFTPPMSAPPSAAPQSDPRREPSRVIRTPPDPTTPTKP